MRQNVGGTGVKSSRVLCKVINGQDSYRAGRDYCISLNVTMLNWQRREFPYGAMVLLGISFLFGCFFVLFFF